VQEHWNYADNIEGYKALNGEMNDPIYPRSFLSRGALLCQLDSAVGLSNPPTLVSSLHKTVIGSAVSATDQELGRVRMDIEAVPNL